GGMTSLNAELGLTSGRYNLHAANPLIGQANIHGVIGRSLKFSGSLGPCGDMHQNRNQIGGNYRNIPQTLDEARNDRRFIEQPGSASLTHGGQGYVVFNEKSRV